MFLRQRQIVSQKYRPVPLATNTYAKGSIVFGGLGDCFYVIVMMRYLFEGFVSSGRYIRVSSGAGYRCAGREWT